MSATARRRAGTFALIFAILAGDAPAHAQSSASLEKRQVRHMVPPQFPDLAKKLNLTGTVKVEVIIGQDGTVKHSRILGGHPVLAAEAERAAEKSTFEPGPRETTEVIEFKF